MARPLILAGTSLLVAAFLPGPARGAEALDNCTGYIDALPATISTQGTWCLRKDLSTALTTGAAILVATNNVIVDCNDFRVGGLPAGPATLATGVLAVNRVNVTVRQCNIRGFDQGIALVDTTGSGQGGHVVERNRLQGNLSLGMQVHGEGSIVRDNAVFDTGGSSIHRGTAAGIFTQGGVQVADNTVTSVAPLADDTESASSIGVHSYNNANGAVRGNRVRGLLALGEGQVTGIRVDGSGAPTVSDNDLVGSGIGTGLVCDATGVLAVDNRVLGFASGIAGCLDRDNVIEVPAPPAE